MPVEGPYAAYRASVITSWGLHRRSGGYSGTWTDPAAQLDLSLSAIIDTGGDVTGWGTDVGGKLFVVSGPPDSTWPVARTELEGGEGLQVHCAGPRVESNDYVALLGPDLISGPTHVFDGNVDSKTLSELLQFQAAGPCAWEARRSSGGRRSRSVHASSCGAARRTLAEALRASR